MLDIRSYIMLSRVCKANGTFCLHRQVFTTTCKTLRRRLSSLPICVKVSPHEVSRGTLSWKNLELATRAFHRDGLVVLEDVIDHAKLDYLNQKMVDDARTLQSLGDASPYNYNKGSA